MAKPYLYIYNVKIKWLLSHLLVYSSLLPSSIFSNGNILKNTTSKVSVVGIDSINFRENWLIFLGIWGEAELILRIWGAKENIFREKRYFLSGSWGDQCIIFRDQGSTDPLGASHTGIQYDIERRCISIKPVSYRTRLGTRFQYGILGYTRVDWYRY